MNKNFLGEIIKDIFFSILLLILILGIISIIIYDKISLTKTIPEIEEYAMSSEMKENLENTELDDKKEVILNYYIDATDLKKYEKSNEYVKGRVNPFEDVTVSNTSGGNSSNGNSNNNSGNFFEDDGTK